MVAATGIVIVTSEAETERAVSSAIGSTQRFAAGTVCRTLPDLLLTLEKSPPPAVVVDLDPQPGRILKDLDPIIGKFPQTRFIVLSKDLQNELMLEAMQVGARHIIAKASIRDELTAVLNRLVLNGHGKHVGQGVILTLLSASGGSGATTLAVNLANELHLLSSEPSLVIDMDTAYGAVAAYLGIRGQYGIADVLLGGSRIDHELVSTTAVVHSPGLHVLLSPASTSFSHPAPLAYEHLDRALRAARSAYKYTVIDAPRLGMDASADLALGSALTLVVFQLSVKDVHVTRDILTALTERGIPADRVMPLASRYQKRGRMITLEEAQRALGGISPLIISNDWKSAITAHNFGQLLAQAAKRSTLRDDIRKLAAKMAEAGERARRVPI